MKKYKVPYIDARRGYVFAGIYNQNNEVVLENQYIKFDDLYRRAMALGCDYVATGHYAKIEKDEEKIKWHTQRGDSMINYIEFGDLVSIMQQNFDVFEVYIISIDWARQIIQTLERSRNVIMHSGVLGRKDIERIGTNIRDWISQVGV